MKCLILAAGYATRLYPLTENFPKPLLLVGEKTIIDWLIDDINTSNKVDEFIIISNHKYVNHFKNWAKDKKYKATILDDGTTSNDTRLGAVKDIEFAINELNLNDDLLVIAGDNVLDFSLTKFIAYALNKKASCVLRYLEKDEKTLSKRSTIITNNTDLILEMEEKPLVPKSKWCCPPFYYYIKEDTLKVKDAIKEGCAVDAPGSFISWLSKVSNVYAMEMPGNRYDIGNLESYEHVKKIYGGIK